MFRWFVVGYKRVETNDSGQGRGRVGVTGVPRLWAWRRNGVVHMRVVAVGGRTDGG